MIQEIEGRVPSAAAHKVLIYGLDVTKLSVRLDCVEGGQWVPDARNLWGQLFRFADHLVISAVWFGALTEVIRLRDIGLVKQEGNIRPCKIVFRCVHSTPPQWRLYNWKAFWGRSIWQTRQRP